MIKAILFDLDNTLIQNSDIQFAATFLERVDSQLRQQLGLPNGAELFRQGIKSLAKDRDMITTNAEALVHSLSMTTACDPTQLQFALDTFYADMYSELQAIIQPVAGAAKLLVQLQQKDYRIAITTNPLYPPITIEKRFEWGGLPSADDFPYAFLTHSENTHFVKPSSAYFVEVLARLGYEPDEVLVIGDITKNDILPAIQAGMFTFQITKEDESRANAWGSLRDLENLIFQEDWLDQLKRPKLNPDMIVPHYQGNIGALFGFLSETKPHYWDQHPIEGEWSILQILSHLLTSEAETQRARLQQILDEDDPFVIAPMPPGPNIPVYSNNAYEIAEQFAEERRKTIDMVLNITDEAWQRSARHSIFGLTSFLEMAYFTTQHDRLHLNQLCQTLGKCE